MQISFKWLKQYVDLPESISVQEVADKLKASTVEVEEVVKQGENFENIVVGLIKKVEKHPDADKLNVCSVFDGQETIEGKLEIYVGISAEENSAPVIDSYLPNSASVTLNSSQSKTFSVNASDADDDSLTYSWKQGSLNLSSTTSSLTFVSSALGPTVISVEVSDGIDTVSNSWNVQIAGSDDDSTCSNGVKELGEVCNENDLGSESCTTQGFDTGTLSCSSDCFSFDTSLCRVNPNEPSCGDGTCDSDETATGCPDDCSDQRQNEDLD